MLRRSKPYLLVLPAVTVIVVLFFGGVLEGLAQSLGYFPALGQTTLSLSADPSSSCGCLPGDAVIYAKWLVVSDVVCNRLDEGDE